MINVTLGSPPQNIPLKLDTGSSNMVVRTAQNPFCQAGNCTAYGSFDPTQSTTYVPETVVYAQMYGEGTFADGMLANDILSFGGATLTNFTFAACGQSNISDNVFGINYREQEQSINSNGINYQNGPYAMKDAGYIDVAAYSFWLNDLNTGSGSVLFGGVDTAKYTSPLQIVPVLPGTVGSPYQNLRISLDAIGTLKGTTTTLTASSGFPITVILDNGTVGV